MKNSGLQNRFPPAVRTAWLWWYSCHVCGENQQDVLHHIVSPSLGEYIGGEHNHSVLNSCPIHNYPCHIGNEAWLHKNMKDLLAKTYDALVHELDYQLKPVDILFVKTYHFLYDISVLNEVANSRAAVNLKNDITMAKYKALEDFTRNEEAVAAGTELELTPEEASELGGKVEEVKTEEKKEGGEEGGGEE